MSKKSWNIGWVLEQIEKSRKYPDKYIRKKNFINDKTLYTCPKCRCAWEIIKRPNSIEIYEDFPSLGLKKRICNKCEELCRIEKQKEENN